jgi:ankyrin repeat protein
MGKGSSIGFTDVKGNTALHWASYMAMENAVEALISWGA